MTNLIGQTIERYHILEQLGEGGMATVYKARDTHLDADVAVKVIRMEKLAEETKERALKRFEQEAKTLARLTHPNIVKVTDYGEHDGKPYLVMPCLPGGTLKQRMGKAMSWRDALHILMPLARALEYAHHQNIIHRDIKPSNILITDSGQPMISDFGVAKMLLAEETVDLTATGTGIGTPEYMAPEQGLGQEVDARADIYSLGIVLYEMLTGRKPFTADTPMAVIVKHIKEPLPRPSRYVPGIPNAVENLVLKALAKKLEERYQSMGEFVFAMEGVVAGKISPRSEETVTGVFAPVSRYYKRAVSWLALGVVAVALLIGLLDWIVNGMGQAAAPAADVIFTSAMQTVQADSTQTAIYKAAGLSSHTTTSLPPTFPATAEQDTPLPSATAGPIPQMFGFEACPQPCNGNNAIRSFPENTTQIYLRWNYVNIPTDAASYYVRVWTQAGREWVRYECIWPNLSSGIEDVVTLTEPAGLHSGEWTVKVYINNQLLLNESVFVEGNSAAWNPAGIFNSCYGKK